MDKKNLTEAEQLLYDIAFSYLADDDDSKPDPQICIDLVNDYFNEHYSIFMVISEPTTKE